MKKVVTIGGGSGSFVLLNGLKKYNLQISAIVNMFDSGGSTGKLRDEFGILPTGDIRRCLLALSSDNGDKTLRELFSFRFKEDSSFGGHSFGNLFLTALTQITGNEIKAIKKAEKILNVRGKILPVTTNNSNLCAELENGKIIFGETNIDIPKHDGNLKIKRVFLEPEAKAFYEAVDAIKEADLIVTGPGDLYTSIIPNMLVTGISEAISQSKAKKVFVCNLMTKFGETNNFKASDFIKIITRYVGIKFDFVVCDNTTLDREILERYSEENAERVICDMEEIKKLNVRILIADVAKQSGLLRHDSDKLAEVLIGLI